MASSRKKTDVHQKLPVSWITYKPLCTVSLVHSSAQHRIQSSNNTIQSLFQHPFILTLFPAPSCGTEPPDICPRINGSPTAVKSGLHADTFRSIDLLKMQSLILTLSVITCTPSLGIIESYQHSRSDRQVFFLFPRPIPQPPSMEPGALTFQMQWTKNCRHHCCCKIRWQISVH